MSGGIRPEFEVSTVVSGGNRRMVVAYGKLFRVIGDLGKIPLNDREEEAYGFPSPLPEKTSAPEVLEGSHRRRVEGFRRS